MKILVTGGAGFIGSHIVDALIGAGHTVTIVDNLVTGRRDIVNSAATLHVIDVRDPQLGLLVQTLRPDVVVHAAAQVSVSRSVVDPLDDASVNVLGTIALLEHCHRSDVTRLIYISTGGAAYGDTDMIPTPETRPTRPMSPYGLSKITAERYIDLWRERTGGESVVLRLANVYGPRQNAEGEAGVVAIFTQRALAGQPCIVNGDGEQTRDFVFVTDVADAVVRAINNTRARGIFNIATGRETSVNDLITALHDLITALRPLLPFVVVAEHGPPRSGEQRRSVLDPRKAARELDWKASTSLPDGLALTVRYAMEPFRASIPR
jgi:UDP-glucose 4-epimerase